MDRFRTIVLRRKCQNHGIIKQGILTELVASPPTSFFFWQYHIFPTITHKDQAFRQSVLSLPVDTFSHSNELRPFIPTITLGSSFYSPWPAKFADMIDRKCLEDCLQKCCCGNDRPSCPVRLIVALRRDCKVSWETKTHAVAQLHGSGPEAYGKYRRTFSESDGHWRTTSWIWLERLPLQDDSTCLRRFSNLRKYLADYLAEDHRHKMCPTVKGLFSLVSIVFHDYFFKFSLRYQIQHLTKKTD